jgi:DNA-directed RNA polymerase subunit RPC12/RpoP
MYLRYVCRHCGEELGRFDLAEVDEGRLGLDVLTPEDRSEMLYADPDGSQTTVQIVCDDCARPAARGHLVH